MKHVTLRGIVQLRRSATGCSSKGVATRKSASLVIGGGPGAMRVFSAATPPAAKSPHHSRTVSSRTPNASAILELLQPASVKSTARAIRLAATTSIGKRPARCSSLAVGEDFPTMPYTLPIGKKPIRWLAKRNLLSRAAGEVQRGHQRSEPTGGLSPRLLAFGDMRWCCQRLVTPPTISCKPHTFAPWSAWINLPENAR